MTVLGPTLAANLNGAGERQKAAAQRAYDYLVNQLIHGVYQPGDRLDIRAVCRELGISRTPVMEAVKRLEQEGFLEIVPRAGCHVATPTAREMEQVFTIRIALEGIAAAQAAVSASADQQQLLIELVEQGKQAVATGDSARFAAVNLAFHQALAAASGSQRLCTILQQCWLASRYYLVSIPYFKENMERSAREHAFIVEAIQLGWPEVAREAISAHLRRCIFAFQAYLPRQGDQAFREAPSITAPVLTSNPTEPTPWVRLARQL